jgi:predicted metal-dependent hydrolase
MPQRWPPNQGQQGRKLRMLKRPFAKAETGSPRRSDQIEMLLAGRKRVVTFRRSPRARRYTLRLKPGTDEFIVTLPMRGALAFAKDFAERHRGWMETRLAKLAQRTPFLPGARIPILGLDHVIEHRPGLRGAAALSMTGAGEPCLAISGDAAHIPRRVADFLKREAARRLTEASRRHAARLGVTLSRITVRDTVSRWGSCSARGALSFSWRIVMAPPFVLDYLAAHEVAHRKEMNHSPRYWRIVAELDPEFEKAEAWLKRHGSSLHQYGPARI